MTTRTRDRKLTLGAWAAVVLALVLQGTAVVEQSLVGDAAYHLLAGHQALRYGENLLNLEHPPLVKMVAALPLLAEEPLAPSTTVDRALEASRLVFTDAARLERVRIASHLLVLAFFGLPFLGAAFLLGRRAGGPAAGIVLALVLAFALPVLPYLSILQTDAAAALGTTLAAWGALGYLGRPGPRWAGILGLGLGLAAAAKFSGVLAAPVLLVVVLAGERPWRRRAADLALVAVLAAAVVWTTYAVANRRYDPAAGRDTIVRYCRGEALIVDDRMERFREPLLAVERFSPSLAQWLTGFVGIRIQNEIGVYPTWVLGRLDSHGRWWYFPFVLLVKTPILLLAASLAALLAWWRGGRRCLAWRGVAVLGGTAAIYLGLAITSSYNLGVRHLLPILPILYLPAARWAAARRWRAIVLVGSLAVEAVVLRPLWMSATNTWWLGRSNPTRLAFSVGDAEYHQSFIALKDAAAERGIDRLHVVYPLVDAAEIQAYLPKAEVVSPGDELEAGWYAVSVMLEQYLPAIPLASAEDVRGYRNLVRLADTWNPLWQELKARGEDHGIVAGTFRLYRLRPAQRPTKARSG